MKLMIKGTLSTYVDHIIEICFSVIIYVKKIPDRFIILNVRNNEITVL